VVGEFSLPRGVLNGKDHDFFRSLVKAVVNQIFVFSHGNFANRFDGLTAAYVRKLHKISQGIEYGGADPCSSLRAARLKIIGDAFEIGDCARRIVQLHEPSKRRKAASTCADVANSRRFAWASPSSTAGK